jgi:hypothetical protein
MKICKLLVIVVAVCNALTAADVWADALTERVDFVRRQLGCDFPYLVAEDAETGRFFAETKLLDPARLKAQGFPDAKTDFFVSIRESSSGEYIVKAAPQHRMLDQAVEKIFVIDVRAKVESPTDMLASGVIIKGVIANYGEVKGRFSPSTYLQLVEMSSSIESNIRVVGGFLNLPSELPKVTIAPDGAFEVKTDSLKPGSYWLYLQNYRTAASGDAIGDAVLAKAGKDFQIYISDDVKSLIFDCGRLSVKQP